MLEGVVVNSTSPTLLTGGDCKEGSGDRIPEEHHSLLSNVPTIHLEPECPENAQRIACEGLFTASP
jgi:hypothetical protein